MQIPVLATACSLDVKESSLTSLRCRLDGFNGFDDVGELCLSCWFCEELDESR